MIFRNSRTAWLAWSYFMSHIWHKFVEQSKISLTGSAHLHKIQIRICSRQKNSGEISRLWKFPVFLDTSPRRLVKRFWSFRGHSSFQSTEDGYINRKRYEKLKSRKKIHLSCLYNSSAPQILQCLQKHKNSLIKNSKYDTQLQSYTGNYTFRGPEFLCYSYVCIFWLLSSLTL